MFGKHLKPGLSRPGGPIARPQVCNSNTKFLLEWMLIIVAYALTCSLSFEASLLVKRDECRKGWMLIIVAAYALVAGCWWKRMLIIVACAPDAPAEEIRSRVPPVPTPPYLFKQKERFCQCHWNTISEEKEIQLFRCTDKDVYSDKGDNERTPPVNAVASISSIKYVNWAAIQNMTNRPSWLRQAYNGLLVLVIKCFHLLQKFQIFLSHHLFQRGYSQGPLLWEAKCNF